MHGCTACRLLFAAALCSCASLLQSRFHLGRQAVGVLLNGSGKVLSVPGEAIGTPKGTFDFIISL